MKIFFIEYVRYKQRCRQNLRVLNYPRAYLGISVKPMSDKNVGKTN